MRRRDVLVAGVGVLAVSAASGGHPRAAGASPAGASPAGVSVVELFTSQGCSSCPPADRLLGELARSPSVIALAWHVDYWNGLGWADPFASRLATDRQRAYAAWLNEAVYTPALVVGGQTMVVGSDRDAIQAAIAAAPALPVTLALAPDGRAVEIGPAGRPVSALVAFYDPERLTPVARGENGGRRLQEFRIVREARALGAWDGDARRLVLPTAPEGRGTAVLVQDEALRVLGAADSRPVG